MPWRWDMSFRVLYFLASAIGLMIAAPNAYAQTVRSLAVADLSFDEKSGTAVDTATRGTTSNNGELKNGPKRVVSPFWNQPGRRAIELNAAQKQYIQIPDSSDVDLADGVSMSFYYLNLHNSNDTAARGIVAKRSPDAEKSVTNYGINFVAKQNLLQLYVNDGTGYRIAQFDLQKAIGYRRLAYVTATLHFGDAPAPDEDTDADDVQMKLFINGAPLKPTKTVPEGQITASHAWLYNVKTQNILNDVPITIGSTNASSEYTSGVVDEFLLFPKALTDSEVAKLFIEVAGPNGQELARLERLPGQAAPPSISNLSMRGLKSGLRTTLTITGRNLLPDPSLSLPIAEFTQTLDKASTPTKLIVELEVPRGTAAGFYPLRVQNRNGVSNTAVLAIDELQQYSARSVTAQEPASLPGAYSGTISGAEITRIYFDAVAGQEIVADVESKRLGGSMEPVLEIKNNAGTPIAIEWGHVALRGDARIVATITKTGRHFVELHDLSYKAPAQSPYRLKLGNLKLIDAVFPAAVSAGTRASVEPIGTGIRDRSLVNADFRTGSGGVAEIVRIPKSLAASGPGPIVRKSESIEVVESPQSGFQFQAVDAQFNDKHSTPITINGRISEVGQQDRYILQVKPETKIRFDVAARSINSPLDAQLAILKHPEGSVLKASTDQPGTRDPGLEFEVPNEIKAVQVGIRDLHGRGGAYHLYRLTVAPAERPTIALDMLTPRITIPENGSAVVEIRVRKKNYDEAIALRLSGDDSISISPSQIKTTTPDERVFVTLRRKQGQGDINLSELRLVGETVGVDPPVRATATIPRRPNVVSVDGYEDRLPVAVTGPTPLSIDVNRLPATLLKGVAADIPIEVTRDLEQKEGDSPIRLTLLSTEAIRPVNRIFQTGNKPVIRSMPNQTLMPRETNGDLKVAVPADVAAKSVSFVVKAELVSHAYSQRVFATAYSKPFQLPVNNSVTAKLDDKTLKIISEQPNVIRGTLKRHPKYNKSVDVELNILLPGYKTDKVTVPAGETEFELTVEGGQENEIRPLIGTTMRVTETGGGALLPPQPVNITVTPVSLAQKPDDATKSE